MHGCLLSAFHDMCGWFEFLVARSAACGARPYTQSLPFAFVQGLVPVGEVAAVSLADPCGLPASIVVTDNLVAMAGFVASGAGQPFALADVMPSQFSPHQSNG